MRGDTGARRTDGQHAPGAAPVVRPALEARAGSLALPGAGDAVAIESEARTAEDLPAVLAVVARLGGAPGVRSATLGPAPGADPFATLAADLAAGPAQAVRSIGPQEWQLELRVAFSDPGAYAALGPVVTEIVAAADRALRRPCQPMAAPPCLPPPLYDVISRCGPQIVVVVDPGAGWFVVSDAFTGVLGHAPRGLPPGGLLDLVHPDDRAAAVATFVEACAARPRVDPVDLRVRTATGRWRVLQVDARTFVTDPLVHSVVYHAVDVTAARGTELAVRRERARLARLVETLPDGVLLTDADGNLALLNDVSRRLLHLDHASRASVGTWADLLTALRATLVDAPAAAERLRSLVAGDRAVAGEELAFTDGRVIELDVVPVWCDGDRTGTLIHLRDVTARVALRRGLAERRAAAVRDRATGQEQAAETSALVNEFVTMVAHELRGPLSSVVAFSCLLGDAGSGALTDEQRGYLKVIDRNTNRLLRLIEDLLLLSRLESRTLRVDPVRLQPRDLLGAVITERESEAVAAGIELRGDLTSGPDLVGDEAWLRRVINNLLDNALRFTQRGGRITIRAVPGPDGWTVEIVDTGIGIPATDLPRLFTAFFRGSNVTAGIGRNAQPGTGLGLVVCRAIVELHGGRIQVASTEGIGTTVTLTLPAGPK